jgi:uncharacterized protein
MKMISLRLMILLLALALEGCTRGIHSGTGGWPPTSSPSPAAISSSAQVVKVATEPVSIAASGSADAIVRLSISPGFHINANPATFPYLIATDVKHVVGPDDALPVMAKPIYPPAIHKKFAFAEQPLAVYEGDVEIKIPLTLAASGRSEVTVAKGAHLSFPIEVRVQACDQEKCFAPDTLKTAILVDVK